MLEQLCYINSLLAEKEIRYFLHFGQKSFNITCPNDYNDYIRGVLSEHMICEMARTPEIGKDVIMYRIRPGKERRL